MSDDPDTLETLADQTPADGTSADAKPGLGLFEGFGIELEYMIVDEERLDVSPIADRVLVTADGVVEGEIENGAIAWSNELVLHVIELKTNGPAPRLDGLATLFADNVAAVEARLASHGARLMPTAMHPWMRPEAETRLWPHEHGVVYAAFDRIFGCKGHGFANLQSMHINLPYRGDAELSRLHTAIRLVLPLLPALAASSPIVEGAPTGWLDTRLEHYRHNCDRIPSVTGHVVPEQIDGEASYRRVILDRIGRDIAPHDPEGVLDPEWVNARGAIVRFVRDSVEIRVIDVQEHPAADLAIASLTVALVRALVEERWASFARQANLHEAQLLSIFLDAARHGERARVDAPDYLACFGVAGTPTMQALWQELFDACGGEGLPGAAPLELILRRGPLARRILDAVAGDARGLPDVYRALCDCLRSSRSFEP